MVEKNTKALVQGVAKLHQSEPIRIDHAIQRIGLVVHKALEALPLLTKDPAHAQMTLESLIDENQALLEELQVSHPTIKIIKELALKQSPPLHTKITGAGGGGCVITLLPSEMASNDIESLKQQLRAMGCKCYDCMIGAEGCQIEDLSATGLLQGSQGACLFRDVI